MKLAQIAMCIVSVGLSVPAGAQRVTAPADSAAAEGQVTPPDSGAATGSGNMARPNGSVQAPGSDASLTDAAKAPTDAGKPEPTTQAELAPPVTATPKSDRAASNEPPPATGGSTPN